MMKAFHVNCNIISVLLIKLLHTLDYINRYFCKKFKKKFSSLAKSVFFLPFAQRCKISYSNCSPNSQLYLAKLAMWCFLGLGLVLVKNFV